MKFKLTLSILLTALVAVSACNQGAPNTVPSNDSPFPVSKDLAPAKFDTNKTSGVNVSLKGEQFNLAGLVLDSKTGAIINKKINITIEGADKDKVETTSFSSDTGEILFKLKKGVNPTAAAPLNITVVANAEGYFSSSTVMEINGFKNSLFTLNLVDIKNTPAGVVSQEKSGNKTDASGVLQDKLTMTLKEPGSNTNITVNLSEGAVLRDKNGKPLNGDLKASIGYFNNQSPDSMASFPGGLNNALVNNNGTQQDGYFMTGGFTSIELTDGQGNKAATFSKPMEISMQIPKGTINPETGSEMKAGDKIGIWSYDSGTGKWSSEGEGTASNPDAAGNLTVTYNVNHLSYWNLDWHYGPKCDPKLRLNWNGDPVPVQVDAEFQGQYWSYPATLKDQVNDLYNVPTDREITFIAKFKNQEVGRRSITLGSTCPEIGINISTENIPKMREIPVYIGLRSKKAFTVSEITSLASELGLSQENLQITLDYIRDNNVPEPVTLSDTMVTDLEAKGVTGIREAKLLLDQKVRPDTWLYDYVADPYDYNYFEVKSGQVSLRVFDGETHNLSTYFYYNGRYYWLSQNVTITAATQEIVLEQEDTGLTISIVKDYLNSKGINISSLK